MRLCAILALSAVLASGSGTPAASPVQRTARLAFPPSNARIAFAARDLQTALTAKGYRVQQAPPEGGGTADLEIVLAVAGEAAAGAPSADGLAPEGYAIHKTSTDGRQRWVVVGRDATGAMYGGLELAEDVALGVMADTAADRRVTPALAHRGIKFNIPLDARTPSYSDDSTSAQANIPEMWSMDFWTRMLDQMARNRYDVLTLWSLSPFPSLVKVPDYPNLALADVKRKAGAIWDADRQGRRMFDPAWPLETVKVMSMDEKIAFWRAVMAYARDRGIEIDLFTWNIFVYGTEAGGYGITTSPDNQVTRDYLRKAVRAAFNTYPLLAGIGVTSGENMGRLNDDGKEEWMWDTFGRGVADAIADAKDPSSPFYAPGRHIALIHRAHQADLSKIITRFRDLPGSDDPVPSLGFTFKYSQAHMHASTRPLFIYQNGWFDTVPAGRKVALEVRNDDLYYMRWGDPDFARTYLTSLPDPNRIAGFYMGPDGYTWGREFISKDPESPHALVIDRMWYAFLLWGRLGYDPSIPNSRFEAIVANRFPQVSGQKLFAGWASVSKIFPMLTRFYWGSLDFMWYPEASWSYQGFTSVKDFITPKYRPMQENEDGQSPRIMSVKEFVDGVPPAGRLTPVDVALAIETFARDGLRQVDGLTGGGNRELTGTLDDIRMMAHLGLYYAHKIRGAVALYQAEKGTDTGARERARTSLASAAGEWREYAALWSSHYLPQTLTRMGSAPVDIAAIQTFVDQDVELAAGR